MDQSLIQRLSKVHRERALDAAGEEVFDLLSAEQCGHCCLEKSGGNDSCPPPKTELF